MIKKIGVCVFLTVMLFAVMGFETAAASGRIKITSCEIQGEEVMVKTEGNVVSSDDDSYYLFSLQPYETAIGDRTDYCQEMIKEKNAVFYAPLDLEEETSRLFSRFQVAVLRDGQYVSVSNDYYITNPEAVAQYAVQPPHGSKKGLTLDGRYGDDLSELGCGYAVYNLDMCRFFQLGDFCYRYNYNGKWYSFDYETVAQYDTVTSVCRENNVHLIIAVKNQFNPYGLDLIRPEARQPGMRGYGLNVSEQEGAEKIEALLTFLAKRYSGGVRGAIHSWIIGNEVNNNNDWHWCGPRTVEELGECYAEEVRLCYNAIKSVNANANVYINLDQRWMWEDGTHDQYGGKKVLDVFNRRISETGNIDWGLSFHPHAVPLFNCKFWIMPEEYVDMDLIDHTSTSYMITPMNIDVMLDYMRKNRFASPLGGVRNIIISEMLFTSQNDIYPSSEETQAAAMVYGYKIMAGQPEIQAVVIHRMVDAASEKEEGMACGLRNEDGTPKYAYDIFKYMDHPETGITDFALSIIGAESWEALGVE